MEERASPESARSADSEAADWARLDRCLDLAEPETDCWVDPTASQVETAELGFGAGFLETAAPEMDCFAEQHSPSSCHE